MVDSGYDISNFVDIDKRFGILRDFEDLAKAAHDAQLKVILDFVPNHSSDQHEWFQKSLKSIDPYTDYYVWHKGKVLPNGTVTKPNNWVSTSEGTSVIARIYDMTLKRHCRRRFRINPNSHT